jgi:RNA recognition motif-containing protein
MNIQVSNIPPNMIESDLRRLFTPFGEVGTVELARDKWNNRSTGRCVVDMPMKKQAEAAIAGLNGTKISGKALLVTQSDRYE